MNSNQIQNQINQQKKSNLGLYIISILLIAGLIGYIGYKKGFFGVRQGGGGGEEENKTNEVQKLETDSRLVRTLYNEVTYDTSSCEGLWEYTGGERSNNEFIVKGTNERVKMRLVYRLMAQGSAKEVELEDVPEVSGYLKVEPSNPSTVSHAFSLNYVEGLYKQLFGDKAKLDTSVNIEATPGGTKVYIFDDSTKKYYPYYSSEEFTCGKGIESTILDKAEQKGNTITIYQSAVYKEEGKNKETYNYVYRFEKAEDGLYNFVSRKVQG